VSPMTEEEFDRLADYCAGLLDPAEEVAVERLIATDPRWSRAHAALTAAQPLVDRALAGLPEEPIPADVAARLDRALAREASTAGTGAVVVDLGRARLSSAGVEPLRQATRLWRRAALATTAVAATFAVCAGGYTLLRGQGVSNSATSSAGGKAAVAPQAGSGFSESSAPRASGTNYTHDTLGRAPLTSLRAAPNAAVPAPSHQPGSMDAEDSAAVPPGLARLTDPAQLQACLNQIQAVEGGSVTGVDLARYQGAPAVVVVLAGGRVTAVAAGPDCGLPGVGPAIIDTAP
jgi:anti-sigma factor RsiW